MVFTHRLSTQNGALASLKVHDLLQTAGRISTLEARQQLNVDAKKLRDMMKQGKRQGQSESHKGFSGE